MPKQATADGEKMHFGNVHLIKQEYILFIKLMYIILQGYILFNQCLHSMDRVIDAVYDSGRPSMTLVWSTRYVLCCQTVRYMTSIARKTHFILVYFYNWILFALFLSEKPKIIGWDYYHDLLLPFSWGVEVKLSPLRQQWRLHSGIPSSHHIIASMCDLDFYCLRWLLHRM